jgi:hypothetical protein
MKKLERHTMRSGLARICETLDWYLAYEVDDAIAERDGKIRALEAMVDRLRNCWNCKNSDVRCSHYEGPCCERWEIE